MKLTKGKIQEIIDGDGNIMGSDDKPEMSPNIETQASKTTDYNAKVHGQNFKNDFLGRFGFYFYESDEKMQPEVVVDLMKALGSEELAWKIMNVIKPHLEKILDDMEMSEGIVAEAKVVEDKVVEDKIQPKKEDKLLSPDKEDNELKSGGNVEKVADLLGKLPKAELDKLINLLESKRK